MTTISTYISTLPTITKVLGIVLILALGAALWNWYALPPKVQPGVFTPAAPLTGTSSAVKTDLAVSSIKVIPKAIAKKKIRNLPSTVVEGPSEITATADLAASENGSQVIAVFDPVSGDTQLLAQEKPAPLFAFENKRRIGVGYGISTAGATAKVFGEYTFLRVGNAHLGLQAEINTTEARAPEARGLAVVDYRW